MDIRRPRRRRHPHRSCAPIRTRRSTKGISALLITDTPRRGAPAVRLGVDRDSLDFNEVFFTDVRVPAQNLVGPLNGGWKVAERLPRP